MMQGLSYRVMDDLTLRNTGRQSLRVRARWRGRPKATRACRGRSLISPVWRAARAAGRNLLRPAHRLAVWRKRTLSARPPDRARCPPARLAAAGVPRTHRAVGRPCVSFDGRRASPRRAVPRPPNASSKHSPTSPQPDKPPGNEPSQPAAQPSCGPPPGPTPDHAPPPVLVAERGCCARVSPDGHGRPAEWTRTGRSQPTRSFGRSPPLIVTTSDAHMIILHVA